MCTAPVIPLFMDMLIFTLKLMIIIHVYMPCVFEQTTQNLCKHLVLLFFCQSNYTGLFEHYQNVVLYIPLPECTCAEFTQLRRHRTNNISHDVGFSLVFLSDSGLGVVRQASRVHKLFFIVDLCIVHSLIPRPPHMINMTTRNAEGDVTL